MKPQMTLEKFDKIIICMLKKRGYDAKIIKTPGRFGIEHRLVQKGARKNATMAAVRMTEAYNEYFDELNSSDANISNTACEEIADSIAQAFSNMKTPVSHSDAKDMITDWNQAKEKLVIEVFNKKLHSSYIAGNIYECVKDLVIVPRVLVGYINDGIMSTMVSKKLLKKWGVSAEEVLKEARKNSPKLLPAVISDVSDKTVYTVIEVNKDGKMSKPKDYVKASMIIVTTPNNITGASLFYDGVLEDLAEKFDGFFYIIPSSVSEFLIVPGNEGQNPKTLKETIQNANMRPEVVSPQNVLSNNLYVYKDGKFSIYDC